MPKKHHQLTMDMEWKVEPKAKSKPKPFNLSRTYQFIRERELSINDEKSKIWLEEHKNI